MVVTGLVALELVLLKLWPVMFCIPIDGDARYCGGVWPVLLCVPVGLLVALGSSGRTRWCSLVSSAASFVLAATNVAACVIAPDQVANRFTEPVYVFVSESWPDQWILRLPFVKTEAAYLMAFYHGLDLVLALPTLGLSLMAGGVASFRMKQAVGWVWTQPSTLIGLGSGGVMRRRSLAVLMAAVAAAAEMAILPCWLFDEYSPPAPFEVSDLGHGYWVVFLLIPPGMLAALGTTGRMSRFFAGASVIGLILASSHLAASRLVPWSVDGVAGWGVRKFLACSPGWFRGSLHDHEMLGHSLHTFFRALDVLLALPTIGVSLIGGGLVMLRHGGSGRAPRPRPVPPEAP